MKAKFYVVEYNEDGRFGHISMSSMLLAKMEYRNLMASHEDHQISDVEIVKYEISGSPRHVYAAIATHLMDDDTSIEVHGWITKSESNLVDVSRKVVWPLMESIKSPK